MENDKIRKTYLVIQRLDLLLSLPLANLVGISYSEELRCNFDQPLRLDGGDIVAVLPSGQNQLVIDQPFWIPVEKCRRGMNIHRCTLHKGLISLLRILLCGISEEARTDCFPNTIIIPPG